MRDFTGTSVGCNLFHEVPILASTLISGLVFEIKPLLNAIRRKLNTSLFIGDCSFGADRYRAAEGLHKSIHITAIIGTGIVTFKNRCADFMLHQFLRTLGLRHISGGVIKNNIVHEHIFPVQLQNNHRRAVAATLSGITYGNHGVGVFVGRQLEEIVQLVLVEQQTLRFKGLLLELALKLLCAQKLPLLPEVGGGKDLLALPLIFIIALVRHEIEGGYLNRSPSPALPLCVFLHTTDGVIQGIAGAGEDHRRTFNGTTHNIAGDHFPLVIKPLAVLRLLTTLHTVIEVEDIGGFGQAHLSSVNGTTHDGGKTGLAFQVRRLRVGIGLYQPCVREHIVEQVLVGNCQVFQTAIVEALYKVIACPFHQSRAVRELARDHIHKIDTRLRLSRSFRHGDRQKTQLPVQNILKPLYHRPEIVLTGSIEPLFRLAVEFDISHEGVKIMGRFKEKTPPPLFIKLRPAATDYLICRERQQLLVYLVCRREILSFPLPAQRKEVAVRSIVFRSAVDHGSDRAGEFFIIHAHFLSNKKRATRAFLHR